MPIVIKDQVKRDQLIQDGYCIFEKVLDQRMLQKMVEVTQRMVAKQTEEEAKRQRSTGSLIPIIQDAAFAELVAWPKALEALASIGYLEPKFTSGFVISKPPHSPRLFWHHDYACWSDPDCFGEVPQQLFLMYYMVDTHPGNGCLRVIPGSHVHDNPLHEQLEEAHTPELAEARNLQSPAFSDRPDEVNVEVKAGDLVIGDSRIFHSSHANDSDDRRTVITLWYHPDMKALSEPVQGFIARMAGKSPEHWPQSAKDLIDPLWARYDGTAEPLKWNRNRPMRGM